MGKQTADAVNTVVGKGSVLEGSFEVTDGIRIDGTLKGKLVSSGVLVVGTSGVIEADPIRTKDAIVAGQVRGSLEASRMVKLESGANVIGDITAQVLIIEEGAVLHGVCDAGDTKVPVKAEPEVTKIEQAVG